MISSALQNGFSCLVRTKPPHGTVSDDPGRWPPESGPTESTTTGVRSMLTPGGPIPTMTREDGEPSDRLATWRML
jgi:hypothetical protein